MNVSKVKQIHEFGQSIWLDFIDRKFIVSGGLQKLIDADGVKGVKSNPAIFEKGNQQQFRLQRRYCGTFKRRYNQ